MYFITGAPSGSERTFHIRPGEPVLVTVAVRVDSEGPGIPPVASDPAAQVKTALDGFNFTSGSVTLDGKTTDLPVLNTGIFPAGVATEGTVGQALVGANAGASLQTTGAKGFFAVLTGVSPGAYVLTDSATVNGSTSTHIDHLIIG
jgi:hypothetical protein